MIVLISALIRGLYFLCICQHTLRNYESTKYHRYVTCLEKVLKMDIFGGVFGVFWSMLSVLK